MDTIICPKGHPSTEADFCSECGARIRPAQATPAAAAGEFVLTACPECGTNRAADSGDFCEICGHNFATGTGGKIPIVALPLDSASPPRGWAVAVAVDPSLRETGSPTPPRVEPFTVNLDKPVSLIGRRNESRAVFPEIALNFDDAVSHRHALLHRAAGGGLMLRDIGATNGTRLNGKDVAALVDIPVKEGDEITLGHFTRIVVKAVR